MKLNDDCIVEISSFLPRYDKKRVAVCSKTLFNRLAPATLSWYAKVTIERCASNFHLINAFKEKCYICSQYHDGTFMPYFGVYAHFDCVVKYRLVEQKDSYKGFVIDDKMPVLFYKGEYYHWLKLHDNDNIDEKKTLEWNYQQRIKNKRKLDRIEDEFTQTWDIRNQRREYFNNYCKEKLGMTKKQTQTVWRVLRNYHDTVCGVFFAFKKTHSFTTEMLYNLNIDLFNYVRSNLPPSDLIETTSLINKTYSCIEMIPNKFTELFLDKIYNSPY